MEKGSSVRARSRPWDKVGGGAQFWSENKGDGYATESWHGYIFDYGGQGESFFYFLPPKTIVAESHTASQAKVTNNQLL